MLALLWSSLIAALLWVPAQLLAWMRRRRLGKRGVVVWNLGTAGGRGAGMPLYAALETLEAIAGDRTVRGLLLRLGPDAPGWASAQAIHESLSRLRSAGKLVAVYLEGAANAHLLVASAADRVWIGPTTEVLLCGVGAELVFYGEALERLGVAVEIEAAGAYKSFGETYTRAFPSRENRISVAALVGDLQAQLLAALEGGRRLAPEAAMALMARAPLDAVEALDAGLVDAVLHRDQVEEALARLLDGKPKARSLRSYDRGRRAARWMARVGRGQPTVVVMHLEGNITNPGGGSGVHIDAEKVVPLLDQLAQDDDVAAVVLHIQSPGGSAVASDLIARSVQRLAGVKPVVAVMGTVAASGGYYIAAPAAEIVARPGTVTGSIGVVGGKFAIGGAVGRFGVHAERVEAGPNSGVLSAWTGFTDEQRARFRASLSRTYLRFLRVVAAGRRRPVESVEPFAQGRVWTGQQALAHGLVDHLGGLPLGVARAQALAGVHDASVYHLVQARPPLSALRRFLPVLGAAEVELPRWLQALSLPPAMAALLENPGQPQAVLPWTIDGAGTAHAD